MASCESAFGIEVVNIDMPILVPLRRLFKPTLHIELCRKQFADLIGSCNAPAGTMAVAIHNVRGLLGVLTGLFEVW